MPRRAEPPGGTYQDPGAAWPLVFFVRRDVLVHPRLFRPTLLLSTLGLQFGCSTSPHAQSRPQSRLAAEFVREEPTEDTRRGWRHEIFPDLRTFDRMTAAAEDRSQLLLAYVHYHYGIHGYSGIAFLAAHEGAEEILAIETSMLWGTVTSKAVARLESLAFRRFVLDSVALLPCSSPPDFTDWGLDTTLIYSREPEKPTLCRAERFSQAEAEFADRLDALLRESTVVYEAPE